MSAVFDDDPPLRHVRQPLPHDSAAKHVQGAAPLHRRHGRSRQARCTSPSAVLPVARGPHHRRRSRRRCAPRPGVVAVLTAADIPGAQRHLARARATSRSSPTPRCCSTASRSSPWSPRRATPRAGPRGSARSTVEAELPSVTVEDAAGARPRPCFPTTLPPRRRRRRASRPRRTASTARSGSAARSTSTSKARSPSPSRARTAPSTSIPRPSTRPRCSTWCARVLGLPDAAVTCEMRRMGGGFGGKESQATPVGRHRRARRAARRAGRASSGSTATTTWSMTGKRHDFRVDWAVGFDERRPDRRRRRATRSPAAAARPISPAASSTARCSTPTTPISCPTLRIASQPAEDQHRLQHRLPRLRRPAGHAGDRARRSSRSPARSACDPLDVRHANFYGAGPRRDALRHDGRGPRRRRRAHRRARGVAATIARAARRSRAFNATSPILKRGIALTPVKFGISFTLTHLNQAGALVHVYSDGSVQLNHGGTEMGQGLYQKVAQVVAEEFGIDMRPGADHRDDAPTRCPTPRPPPPPRAPTSTAWPRRSRRGRSATGWRQLAGRTVERRRRTRSSSATTASSPATRASAFGDLARTRLARRASTCRRPASTRRRRSTGTAQRARAGRSTTSPTAPPAPR